MPPIVSSVPRLQSAVLTGRVIDVGGAALPCVTVTAMPGAGGLTARTTSDRDGWYRFEELADGVYRVDSDLYGFDIVRRNNVRVQARATQRASVDAALPISAVCECVRQARRTGLKERDGRVVDESGRPPRMRGSRSSARFAATEPTPVRMHISAFASRQTTPGRSRCPTADSVR